MRYTTASIETRWGAPGLARHHGIAGAPSQPEKAGPRRDDGRERCRAQISALRHSRPRSRQLANANTRVV